MRETLTLVEKTAFLKGVDVLASIPTEALAQLAARATEIHLDAGDTLFETGQAYTGSILVVEGMLQLRLGRALIRVLRPGMAHGELFLNPGEPHQYTVIAIEHSHVLQVTREDVLDAMTDFPEFAVGVTRALSRRVHELTSRIIELETLVRRMYEEMRRAGLEAPVPQTPETVLTDRPQDLI
jgi:CRP-like cAMP-binding protein